MVLPKRMNKEKHLQILKKYGGKTDFLRIPGDEYRVGCKELSGAAFKLFVYMYSISDGSKFIVEHVAKMTGMSARTVSIQFKALQLKGFLLVNNTKINDQFVLGKLKVAEYKKQFNIED